MEYYASATHQTTLLTSAGAYWEALAFQAVCWLVIGSTGIFIAWFVRGPRTHRLMSDQSEKT
jgi:hypothetical protein